MKLLIWYKSKSLLVKTIIVLVVIVLLFALLVFSYFFTYHYFSETYRVCDSKINNGMSRNEAKDIMSPLVADSFLNYGFTDEEADLYLMDQRGVYCKVKIEEDKVVDYYWGVDAPLKI